MAKPTKSEQERRARWNTLVGMYQRRHRQWTMEALPDMPMDQWKEYEKWVAGFGAMAMDTAARNTRKLRRRLREARRPKVTIRVPHGSIHDEVMGHVASFEKMLMHAYAFGAGKNTMARLAQEAGAVRLARATRQK